MARSDNPVIGNYACPDCGKGSEVLQARRGTGRFLYRRGCGCGTDQRNGAEVQTLWWNNTEWRDGEPDAKPPNLLDLLGSQPEAANDPEPEPEPETTGKNGILWVAGGGLAVLALLMGRR